MLTENSFSKYLGYALGEIILVVIGILIALQINNWNEDRKEALEEEALLRQVQVEFQSNLAQLDEKVAIRNRMFECAQDLLFRIDHPESRTQDSVEQSIIGTMPFATFDPIVNDLAAAGSLRIIKSDSLKLLLSKWTSELVQVEESEEVWVNYRNNIYIPFLIKHTQLRSARDAAMKGAFLGQFLIDVDNDEAMDARIKSLGPSHFPYTTEGLLNNPDYEDHLTRLIVTNNIAQVQSLILRKRIVLILDLLDERLGG